MFDACIIGSGAGGGTLAHALSRGGMKVLVLEKGPRYSRKDFVHDEVSVVRRDFFVPSPADDPHTRDGERTSMGWVASCVGGGTVHMAGYFYRLHPKDFQMSRMGGDRKDMNLADWPYSYDDLEPYYTKVDWEIGMSGRAGSNPFEGPRSKPYPLPPILNHPLGEWIDRAGKKLGVTPFPSPRAILSRDYKGRQACAYCDFCGSYGCETGAKSSTLDALLPAAEKTGRCEVRAKCMVREITRKDDRVTGCVYIDDHGREHRVKSKFVVVACSAVESARLLLLNNLANGSGLVGKNLQFSVFTRGEGEFRLDKHKDVRVHQPFVGRTIADHYFLPEGIGDIDKGGILRFGFPHFNPIFRAMRLAHEEGSLTWGMDLKERMKEFWTEYKTVEFETFADYLPNDGTYVDLDPEVKDRWGLPVARLHTHQPDHHTKAGRYLMDRGMDVIRGMGADRTREGTLAGITGHLVTGTCRAGRDPDESVLDPWCRSHEIPNLLVVDGSFMPTSGGVPPTLTIMANAFRVADKMLEG